MIIWNSEMLPIWKVIHSRLEGWRIGLQRLPPSVHSQVWSLSVGSELNIVPELHEILLSKGKECWQSFSKTHSI